VGGQSYNTDEDVYVMCFPFLSVPCTYYPPFSLLIRHLLDSFEHVSKVMFSHLSTVSGWF